jgi:integrase
MARARSFGNIRKLPSGRYQARYWHLGRQIPAEDTFATKTDARAWLASVETDIRRGEHVNPAASYVQFAEYATEWLATRPIRPRTRDTYASQLAHILPTYERACLSEITPHDVRRWHGQLSRSGLNRNTVAKVYRLFRTIMATAYDDGLVRANPVAIRGAAAEYVPERPLLDWSDVEALAAAIEPRFSALVWTAAISGLRFGELAGLSLHDIDLDVGTIRIDRALGFVKGSGPTIGPPKSLAAHRTVAIPPALCGLLEAHLARFAEPGGGAIVFTSLKGSPLLNRYFSPYWQAAKETAGIGPHVRFHDLRHLAGTEAASAGASLREVMARMGHASSSAALRYLKAAASRDRAIADAIGTRLPNPS